MADPIIITATMGSDDFAWANGLRRQHFPPERNMVPAHISLFHQLPPSVLGEIEQVVKRMTSDYAPPDAMLSDVMQLGRGVAYRIDSPELLMVWEELAERFEGLLIEQDKHRPRLHITVQNKVEPAEAKALHQMLLERFEPRPLQIKGIALWYYHGGPWDAIGEWSFRGKVRLR